MFATAAGSGAMPRHALSGYLASLRARLGGGQSKPLTVGDLRAKGFRIREVPAKPSEAA